jgi:hypothetical protein
MDNWRNVLFSLLNTPLTAAERKQLEDVQMSWILLNNRSGRFFVDVIAPIAWLQNIQDKLIELGRDPIVIGIFNYAGELMNTANNTEWLKVAEDVKVYNAQGGLISNTRPVSFRDTHHWAGWGDKLPLRVPT